MIFDILTLFPEMFKSPLETSLLKKGIKKGLLQVRLWNIRDFATDKHRTTDDVPYGGGGGMIMKVEPIDRTLNFLHQRYGHAPVILLSPQGVRFNQKMAEELLNFKRLVLLCGHYEGVDERVREFLVDREISIGDYILTGGELPALIIIDAVSRLIPGFLGNVEATQRDSFSMTILEYPQYTRPQIYKGWAVPEILLSGNHAAITRWRRKEALRRTMLRRPDLLEKITLSEEDIKLLEEAGLNKN